MDCDVLIVGGSLGGVAAALRAAEMGSSVMLVEQTKMLGGQLSSQGVSTPDENDWIETTGGTASYLAFRREVRDYYTSRFKLSAEGRAQEYFNPGSCWVSRLSMEPQVAHDILSRMLLKLKGVSFLFGMKPVAVEMDGDRACSVRFEGANDWDLTLSASYILDATDTGELLPLAGVEHVIGAESREQTGEPDAPDQPHPDWIQPFTFPFALEMRPKGEDHTINPPPDYERMKKIQGYRILDGAMKGMFGDWGWWSYRRIIAAKNFDDPAYPCDIAMINTGSNDFMGDVYPTGKSDRDAITLAEGRMASLGYVYWLQTECPREDNPSRCGYPEFKLRWDLFNMPDGIAPKPYIRESRRILALHTIIEQEIVAKDSSGVEWQTGDRAAHYDDSCGIGHYWLDVHNGPSPEPGRFLDTKPFQIPLGALIPRRVENLLPACKNLGATHLTNGAFRLHPVEWNTGESAGALAAFCLRTDRTPRQVRETTPLLREFQQELQRNGIPLTWIF